VNGAVLDRGGKCQHGAVFNGPMHLHYRKEGFEIPLNGQVSKNNGVGLNSTILDGRILDGRQECHVKSQGTKTFNPSTRQIYSVCADSYMRQNF